MIPKLDTWGIVIAGHWNRMIFTLDWVGDNLFDQEIIETEIAVVPGFPAIYRHPQVVMEAARSRLVFRPRYNSNEALAAAEKMATIALRELPNTPLIGVGINFSFVQRNPPIGLLKLFNVGDERAIETQGWELRETCVIRKLIEKERTLNSSLSYDNSDVKIDLNFHTDTAGRTKEANATARRAVDNRLIALRDEALDFVAKVYDLKLEEGSGDE